jgi:hypothetical protein
MELIFLLIGVFMFFIFKFLVKKKALNKTATNYFKYTILFSDNYLKKYN